MTADARADFPPYDLLDGWTLRAADKTHRLERLYHQTQAKAWDPRAVLDELVARSRPAARKKIVRRRPVSRASH